MNQEMIPGHKMNKILVITQSKLDRYQQVLEAAELPQASLFFADSLEKGASLAPNCNIWFGSPALTAPLLKEGPVPQWIQSMWAGVEPFVKPGMPTSYTLTNMRGIFNGLIAEYAVGHIFNHALNVRQHLESNQAAAWAPIWPQRVTGKTAGILGVGEIGCEVARLCKAVGMTTWGYTRSSEGCPHIDRYFHGDRLGELAEGVDYLISIMPNTPASSNLLNLEIFRRMKPTALLINAGRGTAIVDEDLLMALSAGEIAGAVLDVFREEPLPKDHPFWQESNLIITSHTAAPTLPSDAAPVFIENYQRFLAGKPLNYMIDFEKGY